MASLSLRTRQLAYLVVTFVSLLLLFWGIRMVSPIVVAPEAPLGLASYLPAVFWVGLAMVVGVSVLAFLDREMKRDSIFIVIAIALGLFLFGVSALVFENANEPDSYYTFSEVPPLLASGHMQIAGSPNLSDYTSWPGYHFVSAAILSATGTGFEFGRYAPLCWMALLVLAAYGLGKRLGLAPRHCFLLAFLAIASDFSLDGYTPRLLAMVLLVLTFLLSLIPKRSITEIVLLILLFSAMVLTHGTTSLAALLGVVALSVFRRQNLTLNLVLVVTFLGWYIYAATVAVEAGAHAFLAPLNHIIHMARAEGPQLAGGSATLAMTAYRYSLLGYLLLYGGMAVGSFVLMLRRRLDPSTRAWEASVLLWIAATAAMVIVSSGTEATRTFIFLLVPLATMAVLSFSKAMWAPALMGGLVLLAVFARFSGVASMGQVLTTELEGSKFFATHVSPDVTYFTAYGDAPSLVPFFNRGMINSFPGTPDNVKGGTSGQLPPLDGFRYVILSQQGTNRMTVRYGSDVYSSWPRTESGSKAGLLYDNGHYQVYTNDQVTQGGVP